MKVAIAFGRGGLLMKAVGGSDIINYYEAVGRTMNYCVLVCFASALRGSGFMGIYFKPSFIKGDIFISI